MLWKVTRFNLRKATFVSNICQTCLYCENSKINNNVLTFFKHNFDFPEKEIENIFKKYPSFHNYTYNTLADNLSMLMNFGLSKSDLQNKIQILTIHPITIKNYYMLLEEGGFIKSRIDSKILLRFKYITNKSVTALKNENYIHKHVDIQHNMLSFIEFPVQLYPKYCDDSLSWCEVQKNVFKLYIGWKVKMNLENIKQAQIIYHRLQNKSFRLVEKSINLMLNEINFSKEKIRRHPYLIHSDYDNTLAILKNFKHLCGLDTKLILRKHPKIILTPWKTIYQIQKNFEEFGIPESSLYKAPEIYTLGSNSVYKRLCKLKQTPELASLMNNPQVARLVYYYNKVILRLKYLRSKNCVSLNLLVTSDSSFNRFHCNGNDKGKTNDIMVYLVNELGEDKHKLRTWLERHPYWQYISLLTIRQTYEFLKNKNFTKEQLCHCSHILLYPVEKVEEMLIITENMKNVSYLRDASGLIKSEHVLSLLLYNLEKDYHFSGDGVWNSNKQIKKMSTLNLSRCEFDDTDTEELDHEPSVKFM